MPLQLNIAYATATGPRDRNEDFCGFVTPEGAQLADKGALVALADGVSGGAGGREAAEFTVRGLLADYYATPDTWEIPYALDKVLTATNRWLIAQATTRRDLAGMSCTLSAMVLRGNRYYLAHVGDSRIYRLRDADLSQLTSDHVWDRPDMRHVLKRAVGLDSHLAVDFAEGELHVGDIFLLVSDGVWEPLGELGMHNLLRLLHNPKLVADELVKLAHKNGGQDNASALVVRVDGLPDATLRDHHAAERSLPVPPKLKPGNRLDDFEVLSLLHESRMSLLYQVRRVSDGRLWVLKTLHPLAANNPDAIAALIQEEWLAKKVISHYFPQVLPLAAEQRSALYYVMSWHAGATLQQHLDTGRHFAIAEIAQTGIRLVKGLAALHRLNILHRDIKPANLHLGDDAKLRILDLGVAASTGLHTTDNAAGTPSFMAPELIAGQPASVRSDLYAVGVTLYYLLTRKYPYGEIEPFQHPRFGDPAPPTRYRPDIPQWLENLLLKAVARDPGNRFETAEELLLALERGERDPLAAPRRTPLLARDPLKLWQLVALFAIVLNLLLLYLLIAS
ncbi:bifunctional protein-serine/threonine kinase/phosphatase [Sulfuriferula sp.]|uniref:bifunctional protein-serine/threonine kinase/phosphatase n=1 Tax=Sulfuriferula sp. TaxID=2025307 RepID=UPI002730662C|nr:bifunctional protein-serine/threonine kinase/phosphatase [Sulfuriferula sp.]MDP2027306.1 bifunctional protein-serine/threonine kinase/phosphatase [Sulfuriferula sp.]